MFREGLKSSVPIALGYFPIAVTFAISATSMGFSEIETILASMLIFAGASQFALIALISRSFFSAIVIPIVLNLRHAVYGCIVSRRVKMRRPIVTAFGLTDEVFALSLNANDESFIWGLEVGAYFAWVLGTLAGTIFGTLISCSSLSFSLTALFFILLIPYLKGLRAIAVIVGGITAVVFDAMGWTSIGILLAGILSPLIVARVRAWSVC